MRVTAGGSAVSHTMADGIATFATQPGTTYTLAG